MKSMSKIIKRNNKKVISKPREERPIAEKAECPVEGNCLVNDSTRPFPKKVCLRLAEREWKSCFYNHKLSFKHKIYSNKTTIGQTPNLKWSVLRCVPPHSNISKKCLLCLYEKLEIFTYRNQKELMNKISELLCKCHHANRFLLKNYTGNDL